jgi:hypothetical protein
MLIPRHDAVNQLSDIGSVGWMQACRRIQPCGLNDWGVKACATVDRIDGVDGQIECLRQQGTFGTFTRVRPSSPSMVLGGRRGCQKSLQRVRDRCPA